jgi:hypothetical protein
LPWKQRSNLFPVDLVILSGFIHKVIVEGVYSTKLDFTRSRTSCQLWGARGRLKGGR